MTEGVRQGGTQGCEGVLPAGSLPLPPRRERGTWPGGDLPGASGPARVYPRIRALTRGGTASLPEETQSRTVVSDDIDRARIGVPSRDPPTALTPWPALVVSWGRAGTAAATRPSRTRGSPFAQLSRHRDAVPPVPSRHGSRTDIPGRVLSGRQTEGPARRRTLRPVALVMRGTRQRAEPPAPSRPPLPSPR
jgi:hypothetical protein